MIERGSTMFTKTECLFLGSMLSGKNLFEDYIDISSNIILNEKLLMRQYISNQLSSKNDHPKK